MKEQKRKGRKK